MIVPVETMRTAAGREESETSESNGEEEDDPPVLESDSSEDEADQHDRFGDDNDDPWDDEVSGTEASSEDQGRSNGRRPLRRAEAEAARPVVPRQSLEQRYRGGIINGAPARVAAPGAKVSAHQKSQLWYVLEDLVRTVGGGIVPVPERQNLAEWARERTLDALNRSHQDPVARKTIAVITAQRREVAKW